jgi:hypothetical protein
MKSSKRKQNGNKKKLMKRKKNHMRKKTGPSRKSLELLKFGPLVGTVSAPSRQDLNTAQVPNAIKAKETCKD